MGWVVKIISEIRSVRSEMNVPAGAKIPLVLIGGGKAVRERAERHEATIKRLARIETLEFAKAAPKGSAQIVIGETTAALPLAGVIDMAAERTRLTREIEKSQAEIRKVEAKFANESFMAKAPPEIVEENRERKADFEATVQKLQAALKRVEAAV
jgi:valyl-tRNA synthetase